MVLGEASYPIYLVHLVILTVAARLLVPAGHGILYDVAELLLITIVIFLISVALYAFYEAPARKLLRGLWDNRRELKRSAAPSQPLTS
jgi:peptidoglycan/LPS O-acetylase OafA/YrhL